MRAVALATLVALGATNAFARSPVDYEVTYRQQPPPYVDVAMSVVAHHAGRTKTVTSTPTVDVAVYGGAGDWAEWSKVRSKRDGSISLRIDRTSPPEIPADAARKMTGKTRVILGETCRIWRNDTLLESNHVFTRWGCETSDGVQLWLAFGSEGDFLQPRTAIALKRRPVAASEVQPPSELLKLTAWASQAQMADNRSPSDDREVVLDDFFVGPRRIDYSGGWIRDQSAKHLTLRNDALGLEFAADVTRQGYSSIRIYSPRPGTKVAAPRARNASQAYPRKGEPPKTEVVLGELCQWWVMGPPATDGGPNSECRTVSGVPLKVAYGSPFPQLPTIATKISRDPIPRSRVLDLNGIPEAVAFGSAARPFDPPALR